MKDYTLTELKAICETHECHECPANDPERTKPCLFLYTVPEEWPIPDNWQDNLDMEFEQDNPKAHQEQSMKIWDLEHRGHRIIMDAVALNYCPMCGRKLWGRK